MRSLITAIQAAGLVAIAIGVATLPAAAQIPPTAPTGAGAPGNSGANGGGTTNGNVPNSGSSNTGSANNGSNNGAGGGTNSASNSVGLPPWRANPGTPPWQNPPAPPPPWQGPPAPTPPTNTGNGGGLPANFVPPPPRPSYAPLGGYRPPPARGPTESGEVMTVGQDFMDTFIGPIIFPIYDMGAWLWDWGTTPFIDPWGTTPSSPPAGAYRRGARRARQPEQRQCAAGRRARRRRDVRHGRCPRRLDRVCGDRRQHRNL